MIKLGELAEKLGGRLQGDRQRGFHAATGWKTYAQIAESEAGAVANFFKAAYDALTGR